MSVTPHPADKVSPITIRLRILKEVLLEFTQHPVNLVSPITIRLRILKAAWKVQKRALTDGFTHYDPFEDTESAS